MEENEVLFTTQTIYTYEEYVKYSDRVCRFSNILSYIVWLGVGVCLAWVALSRRGFVPALLILAACVARMSRGPAVKKEKQRKEFDEPDSAANMTLTYHFYRDGFRQLSNTQESEKIPYYGMTIIETKTNFYLMYERREGCIIIKENCSPALIYFLKNLKDEPGSPLYNKNKPALLTYCKTSQQLIDLVGCPCEVFPAGAPEEEIFQAYERARAEAGAKGFPVLAAVNRTLLEQMELLKEEGVLTETLLSAPTEGGKQLVKDWYRELLEGLEEDEGEEYVEQMRGSLERGEAYHCFLTPSAPADQYEEFVLFRLPVSVDEPWKVLAYIPMGCWNGSARNETFMAISRYWYEKYRAVPAVIGVDTLEYVVDRPVASAQDAWELAEEQFAFCEDLVFQCSTTGTLGELADSLMKSKVWYFWWD